MSLLRHPSRRPSALAGLATFLGLALVAMTPTTASATAEPNYSVKVSPYYANGWGHPPRPSDLMSASGVRWFSMAFILANGAHCTPLWDGDRALSNASDTSRIAAIRAGGGNVLASFGGATGWKLGRQCKTVSGLVAAYQKVINTYHLKGIDVDIEAAEFHDPTAVQREINALRTLKARNPSLVIYITFPSLKTGPDAYGVDLIKRSSLSHLWISAWVIMPFDMGGNQMGNDTIKATNGLKNVIQNWYGVTSDQAYRVSGISTMNGRTDNGETVTQADFRAIVTYANAHHIGRLAFWSSNRDRPCTGSSVPDSCSHVSQINWEFDWIASGFRG
ncbi:MAG: hypothetical protein ACR2F6_17900 [Mycobacteriales bacterium]